MGRVYDHGRVRELATLVQSAPGRTISDYADQLGRDTRYIKSVLAAAEHLGYLFAEDEHGRLTFLAAPAATSLIDEIAQQHADWRRSGLSLWRYERARGLTEHYLRYRFRTYGFSTEVTNA